MTNKMTQKDLARITGLNQSYISALEKIDRKKSPTLNTLEKIAIALKICPFQLFECSCAANSGCYKCDKKFW